MADEVELTRTKITFGQAEGVDPLPEQLLLGEISPALKSRIWRVLLESMEGDVQSSRMGGIWPWFGKNWKPILYDWHTLCEHQMADEFENIAKTLIPKIKKIVSSTDYIEVFKFVEFVIRHSNCPYQLDQRLAEALHSAHAAYRIFDRTIVPIGSVTEAETISRAFGDLSGGQFAGPRTQLRYASEKLTQGDFAGSVRDSISTVEGVARLLEPSANTLGQALKAIESKNGLNGSLRAGFEKLYGYTNTEQGIRHALINGDSPKVDEADALYMLAACAAFVTYLIGKSR